MREPKTADETMVFHGWVNAYYRKYRAWKRMSSVGTAKDADRAEYREAIGEVKAYRAMLEALFNWPTDELDAHKQEIHARILAENTESKATAPASSRFCWMSLLLAASCAVCRRQQNLSQRCRRRLYLRGAFVG